MSYTDNAINAAAVVAKVFRAMTLWMAIYFATKIYQDRFMHRMYTQNGRKGPPDLRTFVVVVLAMDAIFFGLLFGMFALMCIYTTSRGSTFAFDGEVMRILANEYLITDVVLLGIGISLAGTVQNERLLRYKDMGLRGIRAFGDLLFLSSIIVISVPVYRIIL